MKRLVLPSGASQSQGSALVTPAEVLLPCPDQMQMGEAIMTKEAEALCTTNSDQRAWSSGGLPPDPTKMVVHAAQEEMKSVQLSW